MMMTPLLLIERDLTGGGAGGGTGEINGFNLLFIVAFAVFISWLAKRLYDKGHKK